MLKAAIPRRRSFFSLTCARIPLAHLFLIPLLYQLFGKKSKPLLPVWPQHFHRLLLVHKSRQGLENLIATLPVVDYQPCVGHKPEPLSDMSTFCTKHARKLEINV